MKFDVIVGNPPYQDSNGGGGNGKSASALYPKFIKKALDLQPSYMSMITPNKWMTGDNEYDNGIRKNILEKKSISCIKTYSNSWDVFPTIGNIAGGVGYAVILDKKKDIETTVINNIRGNETIATTRYEKDDIIICNDTIGIQILQKVKNVNNLSWMVSQSNPFGISSNEVGDSSLEDEYCKVYTSNGIVKKSIFDISKNDLLMRSYKVLVSKYAPSGGFADSNGKFGVISKAEVLRPYGDFEIPESSLTERVRFSQSNKTSIQHLVGVIFLRIFRCVQHCKVS